jgi:hypothetical protein
MARTRTTKTVAQRIDLNYFKRPTPLKRAKLWLAILAPAMAMVWLGFHSFGNDYRVYSSGRLSRSHAVLEKECAACHVQQGSFSATARDAACLACHDGPTHHQEQPFTPRCSECHSEHRGKINLIAADNHSCAQCHGTRRVMEPILKLDYAQISSFNHDHLEFAALRNNSRDTATIKLNHALHMRSIRRSPNGPMVQLDCVTCHSSGATGPDLNYSDPKYRAAAVSYKDIDVLAATSRATLKPPHPASGRELMVPPKFANACAGCHLLTFDKRFDEGVPHDKPEIVHAYLVKKFADYIARHPAEVHEVQDPRRNLGGKILGPANRSLTPAQWVTERVAVSEELLWHKTCSQCHTISATALKDVKIARWDAAVSNSGANSASSGSTPVSEGLPGILPTIAAANIAERWFPKARFDHDAHRGFSCVGCHQNALKSTESSDILLPGIAVCGKCHAPGAGYAESRCFECHTYHDWAKRKEVKPMFTLPALQTRGR